MRQKINLDKLFQKVRVVVDTGSVYILMTNVNKKYKVIFPKSEMDYIMDMLKDSSDENLCSYMEGLYGWSIGDEDEGKFLNYIRDMILVIKME